jgi:hypothetical protein
MWGWPFDRSKRKPIWRFLLPQPHDTPDLIGIAHDTENVAFAIECKASRMSIAARCADDAVAERGYDDMVKGILQLWKFFSHCRRGLTGRDVASNAVGMVLTLDNWLEVGSTLQSELVVLAVQRAEQHDPAILAEDRRPIIFCSMPDMEKALIRATSSSFRTALEVASGEERNGWAFSSVHQDVADPAVATRDFPFEDDIARLLPWWGELRGLQA